jgi:antitoxin component HigA of HigAB toxin-antitoxin module
MSRITIKTQEEYLHLLAEASALVAQDPAFDSPDGERLIALAVALEYWERAHSDRLYLGDTEGTLPDGED